MHQPISRPTLSELAGQHMPELLPPNVVRIPKRMCRPLPGEKTGEIRFFTGVTRSRMTDIQPPCDV